MRACESNPGWMSPEDAEKAMEAGLAGRMMRDWYVSGGNIDVLAPASIGCEGRDAPDMDLGSMLKFLIQGSWGKGRCTFLKDGLCELHDSGYKPMQCRESYCCKSEGPSNLEMSEMWDTPYGRQMVARWKDLVEGSRGMDGTRE